MYKLTVDRVRDILSYNKDTGIFTWKSRDKKFLYSGKIAGSMDSNGYWQIVINDKNYRTGRLVWFYVYGEWPKGVIDHINGVKTDNRVENLRDVSQRENQQNRSESRNGKLCGAYYKRDAYRKKPWYSCIVIDGATKHIGYYETEQEAHAAYMKACEGL